ncbi:sigma factor-like helix-turn-helix DNA-binding protein [Paractinoplanes durhamensis]|uniref:RNA polymerase sigma factor 70 region 4 type 2 domain-containing protein n=1 Tax=Paractinoplanes durhamensis TaxID=113563 RepID=A0ABQ3YVB9_9ACTN|nr:sigma factor-like helix-turn-helix DNA-binding protein [Actinoplanes durhamensis]GIE01508.1 hypothetical protein Adu01nite_28580 [Actinoplanes durhamensis]
MPTTQADTIGVPMELMLRDLPARHREILIATYFRGRTTSEAAEVLGVAPAEAKARLYRAMRHLSGVVAGASV